MKGIYSQGFVVLTERFVELEELRALLPEYPFVRVVPAGERWEMGGTTAIIDFLPAVNGRVFIDTVPHPWPDHMGDTKDEVMLFGAWTMGHFGPFAYPHGLKRATQQAWSWPEAKEMVPRHQGFIRLRISYAMGAGPDAKCLPQDYKPLPELEFLTELVRNVARHPAVLCYFNPSGEVVAPLAAVERQVGYHREHNLPPLNVWTNIRLFNVTADWLMMDTVGNWQLDIADQEAVFPKSAFSPQEVDNFLRNASLYVLTHGPVIKDGNTMDGPGGVRWRATIYENGLSDPPREVLSWLPDNAPPPPDAITQRKRKTAAVESIAPKPRGWRRWLPGRSCE